jgi:hypothetical protein
MAAEPTTPIAYIRTHLFSPFGEGVTHLAAFKKAHPEDFEQLKAQAEREITAGGEG